MCRLCAVLSDEPVLLADILLRPRMSLVHQSYAAQERQALPEGVLPKMAYQQPFLNADGFGVGWYAPHLVGQPSAAPCVFTSLKPAWNDFNLRNISDEVRSPLVLAHIRAAGPHLPVSEAACHPFRAGRLLFAHNGMVGNFSKVRRRLLERLSEYAFGIAVAHSCIDSSVAFGVFLSELGVDSEAEALKERSADEMCAALGRTIDVLVAAVVASADGGEMEESLLNFVVCDGQRIVGCRYATAPSAGGLADSDDEPQPLGATLYLSVGSRWVASADDPQAFRMRQGADIKCCTAILSSEPLTPVREEWLPIAPNTFVVCGLGKGQSHTIDVLIIPVRATLPRNYGALIGVEGASVTPAAPRAQEGQATPSLPLPPEEDGKPAAWARQRLHSDESTTSHGAPGPKGARSSEASLAAVPIAVAAAPAAVAANSGCGRGDAWMTLTGHTQDVICVASLLGGVVLAAGSMDGSLRLFHVSQAAEIAVRRHSDASGPVLALLALDGPQGSDSLEADSSKSSSPSDTPRQQRPCPQFVLKGIPVDIAGAAPADLEDFAPCRHLLLSTSNNELRVWDVTECCEGSGGGMICLFRFRFAPNQGKLLSLAGTLESLYLGFQSTRVFCLSLRRGWDVLIKTKKRSRSTRHFTFTVDGGDNRPARSPRLTCRGSPQHTFCPPPKLRKNSHQAFFEAVGSLDSGHFGFVNCLLHDALTGTLASGGGDGRIVFWREQRPCASFAHGGAVLALALSEASAELFSSDTSGRIRVWARGELEHGSRAVLCASGGVTAAVLTLAVVDVNSAAAAPLVVAGDAVGVLRVWDPRRSVVLREVNTSSIVCASLCLLGAPVASAGAVAGAAEPSDLCVRLACGGDPSGAVMLGDLDVSTADCSLSCGAGAELAANGGASPAEEDEEATTSAEDRLLLRLLGEFVGIPTISGSEKFAPELRRGTAWLAQRFEQLLGCTVRVCGSVIVARCGWDDDKPLVVLYSHYDVVDAGVGWRHDPWKLTAVDGYLYGRGVSDNKGPLLAQILAVRRLLRRVRRRNASAASPQSLLASFSDLESLAASSPFAPRGAAAARGDAAARASSPHASELPVNVLFVADGGEESMQTAVLLQALREARADGWLRGGCSGLIVTNSHWIGDQRPCICYGMRGVLDVQVRVVGSERDLHSGAQGGLAAEPMFDLMAICASLADASGAPTVPGLLESVRPPTAEDLESVRAAAQMLSTEELRQRLGLPRDSVGGPAWLSGPEPSAEALRRLWLRPSLSITEVGPGPRHKHGRHIAHTASAVVSVRTTPVQRQEEVLAALERHLRHEFAKRGSPHRLELRTLASSDWWEAKPTSSVYRAARAAVADAWGIGEADVLAVREGGTMTVMPILEAELKCEAAQLALGQASDSAHLPNERMARRVLFRAVDSIAGTLLRLGKACESKPVGDA
eukprot:TRINITY_DN15108_c0_g2_i1.p1 TRINITY_DN15108_c0_g2~~TRINITY_DN15108_c0_g2_i1.p1  ORF type:complete len:1429 (-),score=323.69 TRINITY_DN15108_c0_g2_i1:101-4387(-)